jgi:signal transduction histidine kinase
MPGSVKYYFTGLILCISVFVQAQTGYEKAVSVKPGKVITSNAGIFIAERGILDLRNYSFDKHPVINLSGEWEFYWEKFLSPENFRKDTLINPDLYGTVPSYWTGYILNGKNLPGQGFATYRLKILMPAGLSKELSLSVPVFDSSFDLYINGIQSGRNGIVGNSLSSSKGGYAPFIATVSSPGSEVEIIIQVSNFQHRRGGFWKVMRIGYSHEIDRLNAVYFLVNNTSLGVIFSFSLFFFFFFLFYKKSKVMLYFSLMLLGIYIRLISTGTYPVLSVFPVNWEWLIRMEYIGTYFGFIFGSWYFYALFPSKLSSILNQFITVTFGIISIAILFTKILFFSYSIILFQFLVLLMIIYYLVVLFLATLKKSPSAIYYFLGLFLLFIALINDLLLANSKNSISRNYIIHLAFQAFIFLQAIMLIKTWIRSYEETERLHKELDFKNKVFSIIAHDLKAPVASLDQYLGILDENISKDKREKAMNSIKGMVKSSLSLIDNLIYWGRSQGSKMKVIPVSCNLEDISKDILNLLKESAKNKSLELSYSSDGNSNAFCDKELIQIVLRNLVSNAIKFTNSGGKVLIRIYHKSSDKNRIFLDVEDNGVGIPSEKLKNLFNSEVPLSTYGTANEKGTGIGLRLCYDLITLNNGLIKVESTENTGTRIMITLPSDS